MREELADIVHPVVSFALRLKAKLHRGDKLDLGAQQAALQGLLLTDVESKRMIDYGGEGGSDYADLSDSASRESRRFLGARYALVCWLDELFIIHSPWGSEWNERKLEVSMYGTNDRAWRFWEQARQAEGQSGTDALEVFFLCVMLGFRGEMRTAPERLRAWASSTRSRILSGPQKSWTYPPELDPPSHVPPRHGRERLQWMITAGFAYFSLMIVVFVFLYVAGLG